jgi:hypothetical protein
MHDYWHLRVAAARNADFDNFARTIAIAGGLLMLIGMGLMLIGMGSGGFAIDKPAGGENPPAQAPLTLSTTLPLGDLLCNPERCVHEQGAGKGQGRQRFEPIREIG